MAAGFVLLQLDSRTSEANKFRTFYQLLNCDLPITLLVDPVTGAKMHSWDGFVDAERLLEDLLVYSDKPPSQALAVPNRKRKSNAAAAGGGGAGGGGSGAAGGDGDAGETDAELVRGDSRPVCIHSSAHLHPCRFAPPVSLVFATRAEGGGRHFLAHVSSACSIPACSLPCCIKRACFFSVYRYFQLST